MNAKPKVKHAPTPWTHGEYRVYGGAFIKKVGDTIPIAEIPGHGIEGIHAKAVANAAFIVRAVNAYQPMKDALRKLDEFERVMGEYNLDTLLYELSGIVRDAREALAAAEGKEG